MKRHSRKRVSVEQKAVIGVLRAAGIVRREVVRILRPHGLGHSQYNVLRILRGAPEGLGTMEIVSRMLDEVPGITRLIDGLERRGLVVRVPSKSDRRRIDCRITRAGLEMLSELDESVDEMNRRVLKSLTSAEATRLIGLLERVNPEG